MGNKPRIYWFEPIIFLFFGIFHLHRIWGLLDRNSYSKFWLSIMNERGILYFILMGVLSLLCIIGIIVFCKNIGGNYWWRWIYIFGGGYVLFDLFAIITQIDVWNKLLLYMFDKTNPYWNIIWGNFVIIGLLAFILGISIIKRMINQN